MIKINLAQIYGRTGWTRTLRYQRIMNPLHFLSELSADNLRNKTINRPQSPIQVDGLGCRYTQSNRTSNRLSIQWEGPSP